MKASFPSISSDMLFIIVVENGQCWCTCPPRFLLNLVVDQEIYPKLKMHVTDVGAKYGLDIERYLKDSEASLKSTKSNELN